MGTLVIQIIGHISFDPAARIHYFDYTSDDLDTSVDMNIELRVYTRALKEYN